MIGLVLVGFAVNEITYTLGSYIADSYTVYASSALAAMGFVRGVIGGVVPLFGSQMFEGLGSNKAGSILAALATLYCLTPFWLIGHGKAVREKSPFARYSVEVNKQVNEEA